jgi:hypothetical protein
MGEKVEPPCLAFLPYTRALLRWRPPFVCFGSALSTFFRRLREWSVQRSYPCRTGPTQAPLNLEAFIVASDLTMCSPAPIACELPSDGVPREGSVLRDPCDERNATMQPNSFSHNREIRSKKNSLRCVQSRLQSHASRRRTRPDPASLRRSARHSRRMWAYRSRRCAHHS